MAAKSDRYTEAGVDIDLAGKLLGDLKETIKQASRPEVLAPIGGFGGLFQLDVSRYTEPVLVASVDGVGTKLLVANLMEKHDTVGHDIVHHCINDVIVQGAEPLYFMDYIGIGKLRSPLYEQVLCGVATACRDQGVALLGGETAEMPGLYGKDYDLVGSITGVVEKSRIIDGSRISAGHTIVGLASNGLHTNGYSLARKVLLTDAGLTVNRELPELDGEMLGTALLKPHICYWPIIREALANNLPVHGIAHITGGGFYDNVPRVLPDSLNAVFEREVMSVPPIFKLIQQHGAIEDAEMYRVFNMGVGMMVFVPPATADDILNLAYAAGIPAAVLGKVTEGCGQVKIQGID